jgi:hypothetical protein
MAKKPLATLSIEELHAYCDNGKIAYDKASSKEEILATIKAHNQRVWKERQANQVQSAPEQQPVQQSAPQPTQPPMSAETPENHNDDLPQITSEDLAFLLKEVVSLKQEVLALKQTPKQEVTPGQSLDADALVKMLYHNMRGETNKAGAIRPEFVDPTDVLPQKARFWSRGITYRLRDIQIGPVPQALPYGMEKIEFHRVMGPFAVKNDDYPIPQVFVLCQFETHIKSLAELLRKDVRYGTRFTEDSSKLLEKPVKNEWALAYERSLSELNMQTDPMAVYAKCREFGIPYASGDSTGPLRRMVAEKMADQETIGLESRLIEARIARERELSLRREAAEATTATM